MRLTDRCNLKCRYCYATAHSEDMVMTFEEAKKVLDKIQSSFDTEGLKIQFTGGEPLLSFDLMIQIIEYCKSMGIKAGYMVQTNGTLFTEQVVKAIKAYDISIGVSLDGIPEINDLNRPYHQGKGSTSDVIKGLQRLSSEGIPAGVTTTITKDNVHHLKSLVNALSLLGVKGISFDLFRPMGRGQVVNLTADKKDVLKGIQGAIDQINHLHFLGGEKMILKEMEKIRTAMDRQLSRKVYCYALSGESFAVVPGGAVYPCASFAGYENYRIGHLNDLSNLQDKMQSFKQRFNLVHYHECPDCEDKEICGGGCVARGVTTHEALRVNTLECELKKLYIRNIRGEK